MSSLFILIIFAGIYLLLIWKAGKTYPILYLFLFTYFLQYIFSTYLIYNDYKLLSVQMAIKEGQYFDYANPAILFLFLGVFLFNKDFDIKSYLKNIQPEQAFRLAVLLLIISYSFDVIRFVGISTFNSIASFTDYLKYPAAFCFLFRRLQFKYLFIGLI